MAWFSSPSPEPPSSHALTWKSQFSRWLSRSEAQESGAFLFTALGVGIIAGLGAVVFRLLIEGVQYIAYEGFDHWLQAIAPFHLMLIPALGGLIVGPLIYRFAREAKGHGVPEVMEAVALRGGRIRPQVVVVKSLASSICIATGGSVGREGPIAQIGSALGSMVGQFLNLSDDRIRTLVACGAAGGVAATFNAPIAGSIFALEVILGKLSSVYFGAVVISAVTADVIAHAFEGNLRAFTIPEYTLISPWELLLYSILGVIAAVASVGFSRLLYLSEDLWEKIKIPEYIKPMLGGLLLGVVGIFTFQQDGFPSIFGVGYSTMNLALFGKLSFLAITALLFLKMLATMITLGSGGSGGVFAPSLFMGAMLGGSFGHIAHAIFPFSTAPPGAYALVGMAAFFSGAAHAPITAILIIFEMTGNYSIILPLMLATVVSTLVSKIISPESIYTLKLSRRGVHLDLDAQDIDVMQSVTVEEVMTREMDRIEQNLPLKELVEIFDKTHHHGFPVVDSSGDLTGVITIKDLQKELDRGPIDNKVVSDIATTQGLLVAYPYEPMWVALRRLGDHNIGRLPVLESASSKKLVGIIRRIDIIRAYNQAIIKKAQDRHHAEIVKLDKMDDASLVQVTITDDSPLAGLRVRDIDLSEDCLIVSVRRGRDLHIVNGYTMLQGGDLVTVFASHNAVAQVEERLTGKVDVKRAPASASQERQVRHREITIPGGASCAGKMIKDLQLPGECILVSIHRDQQILMPQGNTVLQVGDHVEIFGVVDELEDVIACLCNHSNSDQ